MGQYMFAYHINFQIHVKASKHDLIPRATGGHWLMECKSLGSPFGPARPAQAVLLIILIGSIAKAPSQKVSELGRQSNSVQNFGMSDAEVKT